MIFVDTSAWYARYTPRDPYHAAARTFHLSTSERLVTTDYIIDETLTLFKARGNAGRAFQLAPRFFNGKLAEVI